MWGQGAFDDIAVVPPDTGIVHQVNLEYLARAVFGNAETGQAYPDTLVGTDSHTTMVNGLGVLGWGVGGIEAEAAMLGQPMSMLIPQVLGFRCPASSGRSRRWSIVVPGVSIGRPLLQPTGWLRRRFCGSRRAIARPSSDAALGPEDLSVPRFLREPN